MSIPVPILDTHIHLYPLSEAPTLAWNRPDHPLWGQRSLAEYKSTTSSSHDLLSGFVFLETDRSNDESDPDPAGGWQHPLAEVSFLARVAAGKPRPGEGHEASDARLCKGIVPWAPMPAGPEVLEKYIASVKEVCERDGDAATWGKVKGFRYLLQDKPEGVMLQEGFVEAVKLLGRKGLVFDVGVDLHRRGRGQLEEAVELVERVHRGVDDKEKTVFVLNHLCKPDLTTLNTNDPSFIAWRTAMFTLSKADNVYMKISGCLSEMSPSLATSSPNEIFDAIAPWLAVIVAAFGPPRIMFGSDWPVCTVGVGEGAWDKWRLVVERLCLASGFDEEETKMVFWGTGRRAYGVE
ncbi:L-rhamnono-gamma-lactonase [Gnomoniopsis smithogilvyi]|uniref:L-rhamnono-gamma-lactonase n=1 Tax=Gnomoniopsis smithogilvyi TaxID=1191159 RepID=A0A9W8Z384_9PEZI|nr:L-rhamnono-gamma-lactonase [Gnomoniopsis smithogilvyi]